MYIKNIYMAPPVAYERQACLGIYSTHVKIQHGYYAAKYQNSEDPAQTKSLLHCHISYNQKIF